MYNNYSWQFPKSKFKQKAQLWMRSGKIIRNNHFLVYVPAFNDSTRSFFDGTCKNKSIRVNIVHQVIELAQFEAGDYGKDDVNVTMHFKFAGQITTFSFINGYTATEFIHQPVFNNFAFP